MQVRSGSVLEVEGKLMLVVKNTYTQGAGRQLGNVHLVRLTYIRSTYLLCLYNLSLWSIYLLIP
jgi:hypothetical protein